MKRLNPPQRNAQSDAAKARYEGYLRREVREVINDLPPVFTGTHPLCLSLFQPTFDGGRLVLLDRAADRKGIVPWLQLGTSTHTTFLDPDPKVPWQNWDGTITEEQLRYYREHNVIERRREYGQILQQRFKEFERLNAVEGHFEAGVSIQLSYLWPSPHVGPKYFRHRVPRLGTIYTCEEWFGNANSVQISSLTAADSILMTRLRLLLGTYHPLNKRSPLAIAQDWATKNTPGSDEIAYLLARLFMVHHFFFPQQQIAALLIKRHAKSPGSVWIRHGWPHFPPPKDDDKETDGDLLRQLAHDLAFLTCACGKLKKKESGRAQRKEEWLTDPEEVITRIRKELPAVCAALCGETTRVSTVGRELVEFDASSDTYLMVQPPPKMTFSERTLLPAFEQELIENLTADTVSSLSMASSFVEDLCGIDTPPKSTGKRYAYAKSCSLVDVSKGEIYGEKTAKEWLIHYVRARCSLEAIQSRNIKGFSRPRA